MEDTVRRLVYTLWCMQRRDRKDNGIQYSVGGYAGAVVQIRSSIHSPLNTSRHFFSQHNSNEVEGHVWIWFCYALFCYVS